MGRSRIIITAIAAVTALSIAAGMRERGAAQTKQSAVVLPPVILDDSLPAAVVIAKRPTLSEILDVVLHERPTAAELVGGRNPGSEFPAGSDEAYVAEILTRKTEDRSMARRIAAAIV